MTVEAGQAIASTITVRNNGDTDVETFKPTDDDLPAANVSLVSTLPARTVFESLTVPAGWSCTTPPVGGTGQVQCTIASLAVNAAAEFTLTVRVADCSTPDGSLVQTSASVSSTTADPNLAPNNSSSASVQVTNGPPEVDLVDLTILTMGAKLVVEDGVLTINGDSYPLTVGTTVMYHGQTVTYHGATITVNGVTIPLDGRTIVLLQPQGQYSTFTIADLIAAIQDSCEGSVALANAVITQVSSDEVENAAGGRDGNTVNDIVIAPSCGSVQLRVERDGGLNGRFYTVVLRAVDAAGNLTSITAQVVVPISDQSIATAVDSGPQYTVTSACQ
jgi:hypothetical protein